MWTCTQCGERCEDQFDSCWKCSAPRSSEEKPPLKPSGPAKRVDYKIFRGVFESWDSLFAEAAEFATEIGPERLITISHSEDKDDGVVTVWYWSNGTEQS